MIDIYGTIGPACANQAVLEQMFREGMTGIRLNTSHVSLRDAENQISMIHEAAAACGIKAKLLIDMQGPELRIGKLENPLELAEDSGVCFLEIGEVGKGIPVTGMILEVLKPGIRVLLDDGKLLVEMQTDRTAKVLRGGILRGGKSILPIGVTLTPPAMTEQDKANIRDAAKYGVTGVMQPFVRNDDDLRQVRNALNENGGENISLLAKIENRSGVENLEAFFPIADEIVIARGDLGNAVPLWELPGIQKDIEKRCRDASMPFMVVTQMLASMEHSAVPTRAEVSDIYNAVCDGCASVMVTGETAVGEYPVEVIRYLSRTVKSYKIRCI